MLPCSLKTEPGLTHTLLKPLFALLLTMTLAACATHKPYLEPAESQYRLETGEVHPIALHFSESEEASPELSGFFLLPDGVDALAIRLAMIEAAEHSVDIQTYLFEDDLSIRKLTLYLLQAADRGVRVRLLVDDFVQIGEEDRLAALAEHPMIHIRIFNPFDFRRHWWFNFATDLNRVQRRMHNKLMVFDDTAIILGGRNIGDKYFALSSNWLFTDLDFLAIGEISRDAAYSFDLYWNHRLSVPADILSSEPHGRLTDYRAALLDSLSIMEDSVHLKRLRDNGLVEAMYNEDLAFTWTEGTLLFDHPDKVITPIDDITDPMMSVLLSELGTPEKEIILVTPYFVPGEAGTRLIKDWLDQGVRVVILTNSLASNNMPIVHAGYVKYRRKLVEAGVELWELQRTPFVNGGEQSIPLFEVPGVTLHAKAAIIDQEKLVIGSANMDPRSYLLNTEIATIVHSPELSRVFAESLESGLLEYGWRLELNHRNRLRWVDPGENPPVVHSLREPDATLWRRTKHVLYRLLPVEPFL